MRIGNFLSASLASLASFIVPLEASAADPVAVQYHFAGSTDLARNTNFDRAKRILTLPPAKLFQDLVLDRLAGIFWNALQLDAGGDSADLLRPMLNDLLQAESAGSFGGRDKSHMDFVLAARLDARSAGAWQKNLETALHGPGEPLTAEGFSGRRWNRTGDNAIWILRARDWTVAGRGEGLLPVRAEYLRHIQQDNLPLPAKKEIWLDAEVDWPLLTAWAPLAHCPFKLARTAVEVAASRGTMRATAHVTYPQPVPWQSKPWRIPKGLVGSPLSSFTAARDLAPYLEPCEPLSRLSNNPLTNQFFCWALQAMALESYAAWPATDATNVLRKLATELPAAFNPMLAARDRTQLIWFPKSDQIEWTHLTLTLPTLEAAHDSSGDFLRAKVFPMEAKVKPAPEQLWKQLEGRDDLVYYDWELTSPRLLQWRLLTELLPVFPAPTAQEAARRQKAAQTAKAPSMAGQPRTPLDVTEYWLSELSGSFLANTVTEVTRKSPGELTVVRNAPFLFTGLELVALSHWLADAPVGPVDFNLLPRAKMSGPGLPPSR